ncbi:hypothetical protein EKD04_014670 [Chloroflexales bacterium ZM16-3]|nr:hypothetical protein [Chloroflexales bacterium ZM16-3]
MIRRTSFITAALLALAMILGVFSTDTASAQGQRCFPETNQCISGPIRTYWEKNGGLPIFGFPITDQHQETVEGRTLQVQWFERDRLEIQADGTVTAGRLGVELLDKQGRPWQVGSQLSPDAGCLGNFPTGYQVCGTFAKFWQNNGGLTRLGYPVTAEIQETIEGQIYTVQYFERRRFELHGGQVLLGLLGREVHDFAPPADICTQIPASVNAYVEPNCGPGGTVFGAIGGGFASGESIGFYVTAPDQSVIGTPDQVKADKDGISGVAAFYSSVNSAPGIYAISFEGVKSHHKAIGYFRIK